MLVLFGEAALRTVILAGFVQLGLMLFRVREPRLHLVAWTVVLAASLLMPVLQWALPGPLTVLPNVIDGSVIDGAGALWQAPAGPSSAQVPAVRLAIPAIPMAWVESLYIVIAGALLVRLTVGVVLALRLLGRAKPVRQGWGGKTRIRISPDIAAPVTVANVVLLPSDAADWPSPMRDAVLAHEHAHIARRDFAMLLAAQLNQAVFWFNPLSWWLHRRLAELAELASDDQAVEATGDGPFYAEVLLEMGRRSGPLLRGVAMARPVMLVHRIERVLSARAAKAAPSPLQRMLLTTGAAGLATMVAMSRPVSPVTPDLGPAGASSVLAELMTPTGSLDRPPTLAERAAPEPVLAASNGFAVSDAPQLLSAGLPPSSSNLLALDGVPQTGPREAVRHRLPSPPRPTMQQAKAPRAPIGNAASLNGKADPTRLLPQSDEGPSRAGTVVAAWQEKRASLHDGRGPDAESPALKRADEPSCTGLYLPKPGGPRMDAQADLIQASYFHASDGTPWLKLQFGSRNRTRQNGYDVERTSVRATVVAAVPRDASRIAGSSQGVFGTVDYECLRPAARL